MRKENPIDKFLGEDITIEVPVTKRTKQQILEEAYIPKEWWNVCYITKEEMIFTPLFDEEGRLISNGEKVYQDWLYNKEHPKPTPPTKEEQINGLQNQVVVLESELTLTNVYMTDLELEVMELKSMLQNTIAI